MKGLYIGRGISCSSPVLRYCSAPHAPDLLKQITRIGGILSFCAQVAVKFSFRHKAPAPRPATSGEGTQADERYDPACRCFLGDAPSTKSKHATCHKKSSYCHACSRTHFNIRQVPEPSDSYRSRAGGLYCCRNSPGSVIAKLQC